jgi:hypothetical protein
MIRSLLAILLCLALTSAVFAQSKPGDPIRLTVSPARPPQRPLRYRFTFEEVAKRSGNAATDYLEARRLYNEARGSEGQAFESQLDGWLEGDLKDFPEKEAEEYFQKHKEIWAVLEKAARCDHCDWGHRDGLRKQGFMLAIPEIQTMRNLIRMAAVHCRLNLAKGKMNESLADARLGLVMARHTGDSPILISALVGYAMTAIMMNRIDEIIQQPGAPSLYGALGDLPNPYISFRAALDGERLALYGSFPGMPDCVEDLNAGPLTEKQVQDGFKVLQMLLAENGIKFPGAENVLALNIASRHEAAKKALIAAGRPREKVEAMPHFQVAVLHAFLQFDAVMDEMQMNLRLPPWESYPKIPRPPRDLPASILIGDSSGPALPLMRYFLPVTQRIMRAEIRTDRRFAALRCVEAIRLYAGAHEGKLPPSLSAIKDVKLPVDPLTGRPFEYTVTEKTAVLKGTVPADEKTQPAQWLTYEITIRQ